MLRYLTISGSFYVHNSPWEETMSTSAAMVKCMTFLMSDFIDIDREKCDVDVTAYVCTYRVLHEKKALCDCVR